MNDSDDFRGVDDFLALVKKNEPWTIPTERFIRLNGNIRRGTYVNQMINDKLKDRGLICVPAIENADYYGDVTISDPRDDITKQDDAASLPLSAFPSEFENLIACGPEMPISKISALMVSYDISQLPVLSSDKKTVHGVVTWKSLAQSGRRDDVAKNVMGRAGHDASSHDDFLDLVPTIIRQEYILYRVPDGRVNGIVTASDLAMAFNGTASMYIKLQELESRLRILLDRSTIPQLQAHLDSRRQGMSGFRGATDMMFGEYVSALRDPSVWAATGIVFEQEFCLKLLEKVREVRNSVMHFAANVDDESESERLREETVAQALRVLRAVPLA